MIFFVLFYSSILLNTTLSPISCDNSNFDEEISNIFINVTLGKKNYKKRKEIISISSPQIFSCDSKIKKNIILLSCEALTDFNYLKNQYNFDVPDPIEEFPETVLLLVTKGYVPWSTSKNVP